MAAEAMSSMQLVQALSLEQHFEGSFTSEEKRNVADEIKTRRLSAQLERSTDVLIAIATALVLWYGGRLALAGSISPGDLVVFLTYLKRGFRPLQDFAKYVARLAKATAAGERIVELLEVTPLICDRTNAQPAPPLRGRLSFEQVRFHYDTEKPVFHNFSFTVEPGKTVAIVGPSGIGKSSIFNLLMRFYDPVAGRILIDGYDIRDFTIDSLRQQISIVLQDTVLFAANVYDNIAFGAANVSREQIEQAAKDANAESFIRALPHGYDTMLGERGVNLSHGQRQRIAIARAAVRNCPLLLLDEPTTALDQKNKRFVQDAIKRLAGGRTTLLVTHDLREAVEADVIYLIDNYGLVEHGTHEELITAGGSYAQMFRDQLVGRSSVASGRAATTA
jgi:ATP-binding cassette subfamily B protein